MKAIKITVSFILVFATAYAIGLGVLFPPIFLFAGGLLLILISDMILSLNLFKGNSAKEKAISTTQNNKNKELILHILYYLGQILIVAFIFYCSIF